MKIEKQVCSLSQAKGLKEAGVSQKSEFFFKINEIQTVVSDKNMVSMIKRYLPGINDYVSAYNSAELGKMLPSETSLKKNVHGYWIAQHNSYAAFGMKTEAEVKAELIIILLSVGEMKVEELNLKIHNENS